MCNLPDTCFLFSVASNYVPWDGSSRDLAVNSLCELYELDGRQHTQIIPCFMDKHPSVYGNLLSIASLNKAELCKAIVELWWNYHAREGFGSHNTLQLFVSCLAGSYPIVPASLHQTIALHFGPQNGERCPDL